MVTTTFKQEFFASETGEGLVDLITIDHSSLSSPYRFCNDVVDIVSRGNTFQAFPFRIQLPDEVDEELPVAEIEIDNVSRTIVDTIRSVTGDVSLTYELILFGDPDTVEIGPYDFRLNGIGYNASTISGRLHFAQALDRKFPRLAYDPTIAPALFK